MTIRGKHRTAFKAKVALEAIKDVMTDRECSTPNTLLFRQLLTHNYVWYRRKVR